MRLIDANALGVVKCNPDIMLDRAYAAGWNGLLNIIQETPTIEAQPVVHGRWIIRPHAPNICLDCSECGFMSVRKSNYCPNCGARMEVTND